MGTDGPPAAHTSALVANVRWEWMLQFYLPHDRKVFGDHEVVAYTTHETRILHHVVFDDGEEFRRGWHRVLSLGASEVKAARRVVSCSQWEDLAP